MKYTPEFLERALDVQWEDSITVNGIYCDSFRDIVYHQMLAVFDAALNHSWPAYVHIRTAFVDNIAIAWVLEGLLDSGKINPVTEAIEYDNIEVYQLSLACLKHMIGIKTDAG